MKYLVNPQNTNDFNICFVMSSCECDGGSCFSYTCTHGCIVDYETTCPEYCVALICAPAKVDPFSL